MGPDHPSNLPPGGRGQPPHFRSDIGGPVRPPPMPPGRGILPGRGFGPGQGPGPVDPDWGPPDVEYWGKRPHADAQGPPGWAGPGMWGPPPDMPPPPDWHPRPRPPPQMGSGVGPPGNFHPHDGYEPPAAHMPGTRGPPVRPGIVESRAQCPPPPPGWRPSGGPAGVRSGPAGRGRWVGEGEPRASRPTGRGREELRTRGSDPEGRPGKTRRRIDSADPYERQQEAAETRVRQQLENVQVLPSLCSKGVYAKYTKVMGKEEGSETERLNPADYYMGDLLRDDNNTSPPFQRAQGAPGLEVLQEQQQKLRARQDSDLGVKTSRSCFTMSPEQMRVLRSYCSNVKGFSNPQDAL